MTRTSVSGILLAHANWRDVGAEFASAADQVELQQETWAILTELVADEAVRVRAAIVDAVKEMPADAASS